MGWIADWKLATRAAETLDEGIVIPSRDESARAVTVADSLTLSSVYRAMSTIGTAVKQLSIDAYRGNELVDPAPAIVRAPNVDEPRGAFLEMSALSLAASGNYFWLVDRDSSGRPVNLTVLDPYEVEPVTDDQNRVIGYQWSRRTSRLSTRDIQHGKLLRRPGQVKGLGPIQAAQYELRGAIDTRDYAASWFRDSGLPTAGYWTTRDVINPQNAKAVREALTAATRDREGAPVVGNGLELKPFALSPEDAQWLEVQQYNTTQVARLFGVPTSLMLAVLDGSAQSYQNVSQELTSWQKFGLAAYTTEIEEGLSALLPRGQRARFNFEALLRQDTEGRYASYETAIRAGWMTKNEVREIEGLPPIADLDKPAPAPVPAPVDEAPEPESEAVND